MLRIQLRTKVDDAAVASYVSRHAKREDFSLLASGEVALFKPDGKPLLILLKHALTNDACDRAYPFLHSIRKSYTRNRANYAGEPAKHYVREDGFLSRAAWSAKVRSVVVGSIDRQGGRFPFCRHTALASKDPEAWGECRPMIQEVARLFEAHLPTRYAAQSEAAKKTHPEWVIPSTPFTTITVNNTVSGAYHTDKGDYEPGFGIITVARRGNYKGCELVFPAYKVAVDMEDKDVILFDPHEVHGNMPFRDAEGEPCEDHERISIVYYFRERMLTCLSPNEELARAKTMNGGLIDLADDDGEEDDA